ncbi:MAG: flagellar hook protein [Lachnospiraceae bacterium]|nr:flagellar hook protein [Lachnospiraceae bacterium]
MVVQHNLQAMNANRMLGITQGAISSNTEKLSSGYRINRAADDAAGLSIYEKMIKQIRGLDQASANAEDGISCVQTAEGALAEVQDMLQRMNELVVQAANGTNSVTDRQYIQDEIDQLISEVDRVSQTTKFNEIYLLEGDPEGTVTYEYTINYLTDDALDHTLTSKVTNRDQNPVLVNYDGTDNVYFVKVADVEGSNSSSPVSADVVSKGSDVTKYLDGGTVSTSSVYSGFDINDDYVAFKNTEIDKDSVTINKTTGNLVDTTNDAYIFDTETTEIIHIKANEDLSPYIDMDTAGNYTMKAGYRMLKDVAGTLAKTTAHGKSAGTLGDPDFKGAVETYKLYDKDGALVSGVALDKYFNENGEYLGGLFTNDNATVDSEIKTGSDDIYDYVSKNTEEVSATLSFTLHVGADSDRTNKITANIDSMSAAGLGVSKLRSTAVGIVDDSGDNATDAIDIIAAAIQKVSTQRSSLGAVQNRLDHTIKNLDNIVENTTAAESAIRDTDMAEEMVAYSNNNVLQQAGQSMLAQANQANQGILSLLQ